MKEKMEWLYYQLLDASEVITYVSWLTGSIFAALAILTIFLAYQFQINTSALIKIISDLIDSSQNNDIKKFKSSIIAFDHHSKSPKVVKMAITTVWITILCLLPIWIVSGIALAIQIEYKGSHEYPIIAILLIISITSLFMYFSIMLLVIINNLSIEGNSEIKVKSIEEFKNPSNLIDNNFDLANIFLFEKINLNILINDDIPYSKIELHREIGINFIYLLCKINIDSKIIYIGKYIDSDKKIIKFELNSNNQKKVNKFFANNYHSKSIVNCYITIKYEEKEYTYEAEFKADEDVEVPYLLSITTEKIHTKKMPRKVITDLEKEKSIVDIV